MIFEIKGWGQYFLIFQINGNLISVFALKKQAENQANNGCGFLVNDPIILVVGVFHIAVGCFGSDRLSAHAFGLNAGFYFLTDILCVPLRHDIDKRRKLQCVGLLAVYAVVDGDKAHPVPAEDFHCVSHLEIITSPACHVFHNDNADFSAFHIVHHSHIGRAVKESAAFIVVDIMADVRQLFLSCVPL